MDALSDEAWTRSVLLPRATERLEATAGPSLKSAEAPSAARTANGRWACDPCDRAVRCGRGLDIVELPDGIDELVA